MQPLKVYDGPSFFLEIKDRFPDLYWDVFEWIHQNESPIAAGEFLLPQGNLSLGTLPSLFSFFVAKGITIAPHPTDRAYIVSDKYNAITFQESSRERARARAVLNAFWRVDTYPGRYP